MSKRRESITVNVPSFVGLSMPSCLSWLKRLHRCSFNSGCSQKKLPLKPIVEDKSYDLRSHSSSRVFRRSPDWVAPVGFIDQPQRYWDYVYPFWGVWGPFWEYSFSLDSLAIGPSSRNPSRRR